MLLPAALLGAAQVGANCVPGKQEEVVPSYEVEYQCNTFRTGKLHKDIESIEKCADVCKDANSSHCSYSPKHKQCVVGDANGEDKPRSGVYYMKRVNEDPFPADDEEEDPFSDGCEDDFEACEMEKDALKASLKTCQANAVSCGLSFTDAQCPRDHTKEVSVRCKTYKVWCGRYHNPEGAKNTITGLTFPECIDYCSNRGWCAYVLHNRANICRVFERKVTYTQTPGVVNDEWKCAVKKL